MFGTRKTVLMIPREGNSDHHSGRPCLLMSHIPTQSGGAWNEMTGMFDLLLDNAVPVLTATSVESEPNDGNRL